MANNASTQGPFRGATIIDRRRFLKQTALATAMVSVPYLAGKTVAFGKEDTTSDKGAMGADAALDRALEELVAMKGGPPGVIAVVQRGQHRKVHTFGVANVRTGRPMKIHDRMRIASTSKAFSAAVALSLVSEGKLSLHDTIGERLPELPKAWWEVTLRQLLNHTSGIPDYFGDPDLQKAFLASLKKAPPPEELLTYVYDHDPPLLFDPGSKYQYSNSDNIVVGLMVEAATDMSYEEQLREQVYKPLGLRKTTLPRGPNLRKPFIHGYDLSEDPPEDTSEDFAAGWAWASGGMVSTPAVLNDFIRGYVGGELFDQRTRAQQRRVVEGGGSEPPGPGRTRQAWASSATRRVAGRCGATRVTSSATPSSWPPAQTDGARPRCP